ncbi:DUF7000 family protein [Breznakiellaceae bacterium SP9]
MAEKVVLKFFDVMSKMEKPLNDYVHIYKEELAKGQIQIIYEFLLKYMMSLKIDFEKDLSKQYSFGNISPGYMDFTYFPFFNDYLRNEKLRFGIVLIHKEVRFELWLMGQNAEIQKKYWEILKKSKWNKGRTEMPKYSVLEESLVENPNFSELDTLSKEILEKTIHATDEVIKYIKKL